MKKGTAIICLCIGGCLFVGVVIASVFQVKPNQQPKDFSARELTEEEKEEVIRIALNDTRVKEKLKGKEYKISGTDMPRLTIEKGGEKVLKAYPGVYIYIGEDDWMKITRIHAIVDLDNKKVIQIDEYRWLKSIMPEGVTEKEREEAIKIALSNESVKEKIEELDYRIVRVYAFKKWMTGEKLGDYHVYIHINGTTICYIAIVNFAEGKVVRVDGSVCGDKIGEKKLFEAQEIALNDRRVKEEIERKGYEIESVASFQRLVGKKLQTDVHIHIKKKPIMTYIATVEDGEVIEIREAKGFGYKDVGKVIYKKSEK